MVQNNDSNPWMTPAEVARRWKVSDQTILNECRAGKLKHFRVGRQIRIHAEAVVKRERAAIPTPVKKSSVLDNIPDEIGD